VDASRVEDKEFGLATSAPMQPDAFLSPSVQRQPESILELDYESKKCSQAKVDRMRQAFLRLGDMSDTDFLPEPSFRWAEPLAKRSRLWSNFTSSLLPFAGALRGKRYKVSAPDSAPSCASLAYVGAMCLTGLPTEVPVLSSVEDLKAFQVSLGSTLMRLTLKAGGAEANQEDGAPDISDVDIVGWEGVKQTIGACTEGCSMVLMTPTIQSLVYAYREWNNHRGKLVSQVLVSESTRMLWLDFRTLQDFVKLAGDEVWGLYVLRGPTPQEGSMCIDTVQPYISCTPIDARIGLEDSCKGDLSRWKAWRNRAAAPAPTDFIEAVLNTGLLEYHQRQDGPICAAQAVANVLNGLLGDLFVDGTDVLDYYSAKKDGAFGEVFGEGLKVTKKSKSGGVKFTTAKVGSGNINRALSAVGRTGNALAWMADSSKSGQVAEKSWLVHAMGKRHSRSILDPYVGAGISGQYLVSGYSKATAPIVLKKPKKSSKKTCAAEWKKLKCWLDHCSTGKCGVIYHLTNHYAPIYGYREFGSRRQLLVPFAGQSPSAWQDFLSVRDVILSWKGYNMVVGYVGKEPRCGGSL